MKTGQLLILTILFVVCIGLYWWISRPKIVTYIPPVKNIPQLTKQLDSIANIGNNIIQSIEIEPVEIPNEPIPVFIEEYTIDLNLTPLISDTKNIIVGKYNIFSLDLLECVDNSLRKALYHLSKQYTTEQLIAYYSPTYSNDLLLEACRDLFQHPSINDVTRMLIGQFIVTKSKISEEINLIYNHISAMALDPNVQPEIRMNAADILNMSNNTRLMKIANQSLNMLREEDDIVEEKQPANQNEIRPFTTPPAPRLRPVTATDIIPSLIIRGHDQEVLWEDAQAQRRGPPEKKKPERSLYGDGQNTHNTEINNSVLNAAKNLIQEYTPKSPLQFDYMLTSSMNPKKLSKLEASLHRILTDSSTFKHGTTLYSVFQALLQFISVNKNKDELNKRLLEELGDMSGLCATGHLSRLLNVIQGFDDKAVMKIKVKIDDEVYANIKHKLDQAIQQADNMDELLEDLSSDNKELIIPFIIETIKPQLEVILIEYKEVSLPDDTIRIINQSLNKYANTPDKFNIQN